MGDPNTIIENKDYTLSISVKTKEGKEVAPEVGVQFPQQATELQGIDCITIVKAKVNPGYIVVCSGNVCRKYLI